jgi:hypothetical protein
VGTDCGVLAFRLWDTLAEMDSAEAAVINGSCRVAALWAYLCKDLRAWIVRPN